MSRIILTAVALFGFGAGPQTLQPKAPAAPKACATVDSSDIGKLPLTLTVGSVQVEFVEWKQRELDTNESVGFIFNATGPLTWVAESGAERGFTGSGTAFLDELAVVKADAPTLSRITFCSK